jgi:hypothetical protein
MTFFKNTAKEKRSGGGKVLRPTRTNLICYDGKVFNFVRFQPWTLQEGKFKKCIQANYELWKVDVSFGSNGNMNRHLIFQ